MLGEIVDCLRCVGIRQVWRSKVDRATQFLLDKHGAEGGWGDPEDVHSVHIAHVCGLALLERGDERSLGTFTSPLAHEAYWKLAPVVFGASPSAEL